MVAMPIQITRRCALLLAGAIALNISLGQLAISAGWPLYLDMVGTVVMGIMCGPLAAACCGGLSLLLWSCFRPDMWAWIPVAMGIGLAAGFGARWRFFISPTYSIIAGFILALTATVISTPIRLFFTPEYRAGETIFSIPLIEAGHEMFAAILSSIFLVEMVDKVTVCLLALALLRLMPRRWMLEARKHLHGQPGWYNPPALSVVCGYCALLFLYGTFFVLMFVSPSAADANAPGNQTLLAINAPLLQTICVYLSQFGHWIALSLVAITFVTTLHES